VKTPNHRLAALVTESGLSRVGVARRIRERSLIREQPVRTTTTAVTRWITDGDIPRRWTRELLSEVLSEKLERDVTQADLGFPTVDADPQATARITLRYDVSTLQTVKVLTDLTAVDLGGDAVDRRKFLSLASFSAGALTGPSRDWLLAALTQTPVDRPARVGSDQVAALHDTFRAFQRLDTSHGGGHARTALVQYLHSTVLPLLDHAHDERTRQNLFEAAAEHTYLVAWMTWDDAEPGLAQRYFTQALRLAQEAGEPLLGSHVLTGTAHLTLAQGQPREALQMLRAAHAGAGPGTRAAPIRARAHVLQARALAALGERQEAAAELRAAEHDQDRIHAGKAPRYADYIDVAYLAGESAAALSDLRDSDPALRSAETALAAADHRGRRAAFTYATLATSHVGQGDLDAAADAARLAHSIAARTTSHRARQAATAAITRLHQHAHVPVVGTMLTSLGIALS
jgi:hypothetical protein